MNIKKILKNKKIIISVLAVILIVALILVFNNKNDGMLNTRKVSIYYKTYTDKGWSKWSKNGITSGNKEDSIKNIKIKVKTKVNGYVIYSVYNNKWKDNLEEDKKIKNNEIYGFKFSNINTLNKEFDICYRTYNKKDKWLNWACNGDISGNIKENITALEIKIIPKNVVKYDWLKDYNKTLNEPNIGF